MKQRKIHDSCMRYAKAIVHIRDMETCQLCWSQWVELHCSHVINDWRNKRLSVNERNMKLLCFYCHRKRHEKPWEWLIRFKWKFKSRRKYLEEESQKINWTISSLEREMIRDWLKESLKKWKIYFKLLKSKTW